jgi:NitT/TauT family transport system substrate-binding protein
MVADKGSCPANYGYGPLMVRKDLVTSGKFKTVKDLKGMKFAESAPGSILSSTINRLMKSVGLSYNDVQHVYLGFPAQVLAFAGGSIDAALTAEPNATVAERQGVAVRIMGNDKWYPGQEQSVVQYGSSFLHNRQEVAMKFMVAYVRGARYFNDALLGGHIKGRNASSIIDILCDVTGQKDRTIYSDMVSNAVNPNGKMNAVSLAEDLNFFKFLGLVQSDVSVARATDSSFQEAALAKLGPYKPNKG